MKRPEPVTKEGEQKMNGSFMDFILLHDIELLITCAFAVALAWVVYAYFP